MRVEPIQPIATFIRNFKNKEDENILVKGPLNSQVIAHLRPTFTGHWPNYYTDSTMIYHNDPQLPEGVGNKLNFIA